MFRLAPNAPPGALPARVRDALLRLDSDDDGPFRQIRRGKPALGKEKKPHPRKNFKNPLCSRVWEFWRARQAHLDLLPKQTGPRYGKQVVDLRKRGYSTRCWKTRLQRARGPRSRRRNGIKRGSPSRWPALKVGVAIHHGRLPSPFPTRTGTASYPKERLKVIVASPTLAGSSTLNAAVLLVPALYRAPQKKIKERSSRTWPAAPDVHSSMCRGA